MRFALVLVVIIVLVAVFVLNPIDSLAYAESDKKAQAVSKDLVTSNTKFGLKIFKEVSKEDEGKNVFISPFSISTALAMTYNGADKETKESMAQTLEFSEFDIENLNQEYATLIESLEHVDSKVKLSIANSIFINKIMHIICLLKFIQCAASYKISYH